MRSILALQDTDFINEAYRRVLQRLPDERGLDFYLTRLKSGVSKTQILGELCRSEEAKSSLRHLPGLQLALIQNRLTAVPIVGRLVGFCLGIEGDTAPAKRIRAMEQHAIRLSKIADELCTRQAQVEKSVSRAEALVAQSAALIAELAHTVSELNHRQQSFEERQLPSLLQSIGELNHRQLSSDHAHDNLVRSAPIAFRKIAREIAELQSSRKHLEKRRIPNRIQELR